MSCVETAYDENLAQANRLGGTTAGEHMVGVMSKRVS